MLALVVRCGDQTLRLAVPPAVSRLGADPAADLVVPFSGVSRLHATVEPAPGGVRVADAGSKNGLSFGGRRVPECHLLPGDVVRLGRAWLGLEECDTADVEPALAFDAGPAGTRTPPPRRRTESDLASSQTGASRGTAFRLLQELDRLGPAPAPSDPRVPLLLGWAREALGAQALGLVETGRQGVPRPVVVVGEAADLAALLRSADSPAGRGPRRTARVRRNDATGLAILVAFPEAATPPAWWTELFEFLASRLLGLPAVLPPPVLGSTLVEPGVVLPPGMVAGVSPAMRSLLAQVAATVKSRMDVLLLGETGTGKELLARLVHASGPTSKGPFIAINCAAIPAELLEAELFGIHGRVATGVDPRVGRLQQADGGTVFLDEVGELADPLQAKLLRFLQQREIQPLGAPAPRPVDVRVVSASNRDLPLLVREGRFRADLFFRLSGLQFHIPPLRERREDVPDLVAAIVRKAAAEEGKHVRGVNRRALGLLGRYDWPGNVRELENEVRRAVLLCPDGGLLQAEHFGRLRWAVEGTKAGPQPTVESTPPPRAATLREKVDDLERHLVEDALRASGGNKTRAAAALGITRPGLIQMLRRLGGKG